MDKINLFKNTNYYKKVNFFLRILAFLFISILHLAIPYTYAEQDFNLDQYTNQLLNQQNGGKDQNGNTVNNGDVTPNYSKIIVDVKFYDNSTQAPITFEAGNLIMCLGTTATDCKSAQEVNNSVNTITINQNISSKTGYFRLKNAAGKNLLKGNFGDEYRYPIDWGSSPDQKIESNGIITKNTLMLFLTYDSENEQYYVANARIKELTEQSSSNITNNIGDNLKYSFRGKITLDRNLLTLPKIIISNEKKVVKDEFAVKDGDAYTFNIDLSDLDENQGYSFIYEVPGYISKGEYLRVGAKSDLYTFTNKVRNVNLEYDKRNDTVPADIPWFFLTFLGVIQSYIFIKLWKSMSIVKNLQDY